LKEGGKVLILDGYVDEPACLGVPPYVSPYPRYIAGAVRSSAPKSWTIDYLTIDAYRARGFLPECDVLILIAGSTVPGNYLGGIPAGLDDVVKIAGESRGRGVFSVLAGPAASFGVGTEGGRMQQQVPKDAFDLVCSKGDAEKIVFDLFTNELKSWDENLKRESPEDIKDWSVIGAGIVIPQHPNHESGFLIAEIETYKGCVRYGSGGCSFCSEPLKGPPQFRAESDIIEEIVSLRQAGVKAFRLGNQTCLFSYKSESESSKGTTLPRPNPEALEKLYSGIRNAVSDLEVLHMDNANPLVIASYPGECMKIAKTIVKYNTPGDVAALGIESVDPEVIKRNNLKVSEDEALTAIRIINEAGALRKDEYGLPSLLPGINFVSGLDGETKMTFSKNYAFLERVMSEGLLVRRINIRQVLQIPGTRAYSTARPEKRHVMFQSFKRKVRENIDNPMLKKVAPIGTIVKKVFTEAFDNGVTFARPLASYPLLIGIPVPLPLHIWLDKIMITDHGFRSLTGIPVPIDPNTASRDVLECIPGIGSKRCARIVRERPFRDWNEFENAVGIIPASPEWKIIRRAITLPQA